MQQSNVPLTSKQSQTAVARPCRLAMPRTSANFPLTSFGRTELAQLYFPYIQPQSAWLKLKTLLLDDPDLAPLATLRRRTFLPAEVAKIYEILGHP